MRHRKIFFWFWMMTDFLGLMMVSLLACEILGRWPEETAALLVVLAMAAVRVFALIQFGEYRALARYSGINDMMKIGASLLIGTLLAVIIGFGLLDVDVFGLGRAFFVLEFLVAFVLLTGLRLGVRVHFDRSREKQAVKRVLIFGAGQLGELASRIILHAGMRPVGFLDDDPQKHKGRIRGMAVLGLPEQVLGKPHLQVDLVLVAVRNLDPERLRTLSKACMDVGIPMQRASLPEAYVDPQGDFRVEDISLEELLPRGRRSLDEGPVAAQIQGAVVLVTGAGGSIGSELCRQIAEHKPKVLFMIDSSEYSLYKIHAEVSDCYCNVESVPLLCDMTHRDHLRSALRRANPKVVYHAAAYKHVPLVEQNPCVGLYNNIGSISNLIELLPESAEYLVLVSTDKAVRPTNIMGASKRVCERLLRAHALTACADGFCAVRFGNVLGSSGSVVPRFVEQIRHGGPVTVTDPDMTRYFMLIPEAVELILQAGAMGEQGDIFILNMGEPVRIIDMAKQLIFLAGKVPDEEVEISIVGKRPGEKVHEELLRSPDDIQTKLEQVTIARDGLDRPGSVLRDAAKLLIAAERGDLDECKSLLSSLVPEWNEFRNGTSSASSS